MSDQLDMMFISAHPNGVAQCPKPRSPVPGQTASSRRPSVRRGTRPRVQRPAPSRTGRARARRPRACRRACRPMTGTATRRWPPTSPTWTRAGPGSRRSGRSRARPPPSAWATPPTSTLPSWPPCSARTGWAGRCSPGTGPRTRCAPGPVLAALTEQAAGGLGRLTDNQVVGAMSAARRLAARAAWLELAAVAEFTRRREAQLADATARGVPRGCRDGEFPDAELGMELVTSPNAARDTMDLAGDLQTRLPRTWAALGAGLIDEYRARLIWRPTRHLSDADAARADEILAALAPGLRYDQLARKAAAVAMKLDPDAFKRGKEQGPRRPAAGGGRAGGVRQRVPVRPGAGDRGRAGVEGAHRRARGRAAPRRAARHPAAAAGAGVQRPDPGPRPAGPGHRPRAR